MTNDELRNDEFELLLFFFGGRLLGRLLLWSERWFGSDMEAASSFEFAIKFHKRVGSVAGVFCQHPMDEFREIGLDVFLQNTDVMRPGF